MITSIQNDKITVPCEPVFCITCSHYIGDVVEIPTDIQCPYCKHKTHCDYEYRR